MNQVYQAVSQAVLAVGLLINVIVFLVIVYVLKEVVRLLSGFRAMLEKQETPRPIVMASTSTGGVIETPQPIVVFRPEDSSPKDTTSEPVALQKPEPALAIADPVCQTCKGKVKKITNSFIQEGKTIMIFKCQRCGKETPVPSELVPDALLGGQQ